MAEPKKLAAHYNKWDNFDADAEMAKLDTPREAKERVAASDQLEVMPPEVGLAAPDNLLHKFFHYAMHTVNVKMMPFFSDNVHAFEDMEDLDAKGETLEQYAVYQKYTAELEANFDIFVRAEGFSDAQQVFDQISKLVKEDKDRHEADLAKVVEELKGDPRLRALIEGAANEAGLGGGEAKTGDPDDKGVPMCLLMAPAASEQMVDMVLSLGEYETFASMMRLLATQLAMVKTLQAQLSRLKDKANELEALKDQLQDEVQEQIRLCKEKAELDDEIEQIRRQKEGPPVRDHDSAPIEYDDHDHAGAKGEGGGGGGPEDELPLAEAKLGLGLATAALKAKGETSPSKLLPHEEFEGDYYDFN